LAFKKHTGTSTTLIPLQYSEAKKLTKLAWADCSNDTTINRDVAMPCGDIYAAIRLVMYTFPLQRTYCAMGNAANACCSARFYHQFWFSTHLFLLQQTDIQADWQKMSCTKLEETFKKNNKHI